MKAHLVSFRSELNFFLVFLPDHRTKKMLKINTRVEHIEAAAETIPMSSGCTNANHVSQVPNTNTENP